MKEEKHKQLESTMKQKIDLIIRNELSDPRLKLMSITYLMVSKELDFANVYVSHVGDEETRKAVVDALNKASGYIEKNLARSMSIRRIPKLKFKLDDSLIYAAKIETIFETIHSEKKNTEEEKETEKENESE